MERIKTKRIRVEEEEIEVRQSGIIAGVALHDVKAGGLVTIKLN